MKRVLFFIIVSILFIPCVNAATSFTRECVYNAGSDTYKIVYTEDLKPSSSSKVFVNGRGPVESYVHNDLDLSKKCPNSVYILVAYNGPSGNMYNISLDQRNGSINGTLNVSSSVNHDVDAQQALVQKQNAKEDKSLILECPYTVDGKSLKLKYYNGYDFELKVNGASTSSNIGSEVKEYLRDNKACPDQLYFKQMGNGNQNNYNVSLNSFNGASAGDVDSDSVRQGESNNVVFNQITPQKIMFCEQNNVLQVFKIGGIALFVLKILIPLIIIILGVIDFTKALMNDDEKKHKEAFYIFARRIIAGIIVFFIPTIIGFVFSLIDDYDNIESGFKNCENCLIHPLDSGKCSVHPIVEDLG